MTDTIKTLPSYDTTLTHMGYYIHPKSGVLKFSGEDRDDFLQRQTTNDMGLLSEQNWIQNVLTTPAARIIDVFQLVQHSDEIIAISTLGRISESFTFMKGKIFFMDKVEVVDVSGEYEIIDIEGPNAGGALDDLGFIGSEVLGEAGEFEFEDEDILVLTQQGIVEEIGYRLIVPTDKMDDLTDIIDKAGAAKLQGHVYEVLRIEAGFPAGANELNGSYTPLETNLRSAVSDNKGCYTGQEVIARQISYDKITKQVVQLLLDSAVDVGAKVAADGKSVGVVTSAGLSPRMGAIALAMLKRPHFEGGTPVVVGEGITGEVVSLGE